MKRSYPSGAQKRAKIAERERQISNLPKISEFYQVINKDNCNASNIVINLEQEQNQLIISNDAFDKKKSDTCQISGK